MDGALGSIVFLAFMVFVPLAMVVFLIVRRIKRGLGKTSLENWARSKGWGYSTQDRDGNLSRLLQPFLAQRQGRHRLERIVTLGIDTSPSHVAEYHYRAPTAQRQNRGGVYSIALSGRSGTENLLLVGRQSGTLAGIAERVAGSALTALESPWDGLLASSREAFEGLHWSSESRDSIKAIIRPGDALILWDGSMVLSRTGELDEAVAEDLLDAMKILATLIP